MVQNKLDNVFKEGDVVYITNSYAASEECYSAYVQKALTNEDCGGLGIHYAILVPTHIEDYMVIREANRCFRSPEQYEQLRADVRRRSKEMREQVRQSVKELFK